MSGIDQLLQAAADLEKIGVEAARAYNAAADRMTVLVNRALLDHPDLERLLGDNTFELFEDNHHNHVRFMGEMLLNGGIDGLVASLPWVYRSYHNQGVDYDYFPIALRAWIEAIRAEIELPGRHTEAAQLIGLYRWLIDHHDAVIRLAEMESPHEHDRAGPWAGHYAEFFDRLRSRDHRACREVCRAAVREGATQADIFQYIVYPAMTAIGELWEAGKIGVADEHMSTAIVNNVVISLYTDAPLPEYLGGVAVVATAPDEHHEMGAWMVATCLELEGWNVIYLGSDLPADEIARAVVAHRADLVALSVAMPFNVDAVRTTVATIRRGPEPHPAIVIGGGAFVRYPHLIETVDADAYFADGRSAAEWARQFRQATPAEAT